MRAIFMACAVTAWSTIAGCSQASAAGLDPSNPLHCAAQFESYSILARQQGDVRKDRFFGARSQWYVNRAKARGINLSDAALIDVEKRVMATADGGLGLAKECLKRQDDDPEFPKSARRN